MMMKIAATVLALAVIGFGCGTSAPPTGSVWAAISSDRVLYDLPNGEVNISFAVVNDGERPILCDDIHARTRIIVNGKERPDSDFIFGNGPRSREKELLPGDTYQFTIQLTSLFAEPGSYEVIWTGKEFRTKPIVFRVKKMEAANKASHRISVRGDAD